MIIILILVALTLITLIFGIKSCFMIKEYDEKYVFDETSEEKRCVYRLTIEDDAEKEKIVSFLKTHLDKDSLIYYRITKESRGTADILNNCKYEEVPAKKVSKHRIAKIESLFKGVSFAFMPGIPTLVIFGVSRISTSSYVGEYKKIEINEKISELEHEKTILLSYFDINAPKSIDLSSMNLPERITTHNKNARELIVDVKHGIARKENPWINWFVNPVYTTIDISRIEATYINL